MLFRWKDILEVIAFILAVAAITAILILFLVLAAEYIWRF